MCTAITFHAKDHYFGRNLDLEYHYHESVTVMPRNFPIFFRQAGRLKSHYAIIGIATVADGYPLFYDAVNEHGLSIAGLNFPSNACYHPQKDNAVNIAPFELIPWILCQCKTVEEAVLSLEQINLMDLPFSKDYPVSPLHWIVADKRRSITVEPMMDGVRIHENPVGVLTNNPPFDFHMHYLSHYLNLTNQAPDTHFAGSTELTPYSRGLGAVGLPGDLSSLSRFVRAAFTKMNALAESDELCCVGQFFHILDAVAQVNGCCCAQEGYVKTIYSCCCNMDRGVYYYVTYDNRQISAVDLYKTDLNADTLCIYPLEHHQQINWLN